MNNGLTLGVLGLPVLCTSLWSSPPHWIHLAYGHVAMPAALIGPNRRNHNILMIDWRTISTTHIKPLIMQKTYEATLPYVSTPHTKQNHTQISINMSSIELWVCLRMKSIQFQTKHGNMMENMLERIHCQNRTQPTPKHLSANKNRTQPHTANTHTQLKSHLKNNTTPAQTQHRHMQNTTAKKTNPRTNKHKT